MVVQAGGGEVVAGAVAIALGRRRRIGVVEDV
jgi:hypothetical protein